MSIVGPRPERWEHDEKYTKEVPEWPLRLSNYDLTVFVNFDLGVVCCVRNFTSFLSYP